MNACTINFKDQFKLLNKIFIGLIIYSFVDIFYCSGEKIVASTSITEIKPKESSVCVLQESLSRKLLELTSSTDPATGAKTSSQVPKIRLNILVHGTMASEGALLNFGKMLDCQDMAGTISERRVRNVCREQLRLHYNVSALIQEGFYRIEPKPLDQLEPENRCFGVFAIIKMLEFARQNASKDSTKPLVIDLYYVFGWSGMLSQYERVKSAICFYNALCQELSDINKALQECVDKGLIDQIPEVESEAWAHSHGANTSLLLALVEAKVKKEDLWDTYAFFSHHSIYSRQAQMLDLILKKYCSDSLESKQAREKLCFNMEQWLYTPTEIIENRPLVNTLHMLGGPIQPENFPLGFSKTFDRVYNWFSPTDNIQNLDKFSVLSRKCQRLVDPELVSQANEKFKFTQSTSKGFFQREILFKLYPKRYGPSHLELWMLNFKEGASCILRPIPFFCLIPFLQEEEKIKNQSFAGFLFSKNPGQKEEQLNCQVLGQNNVEEGLIIINKDKFDAMKAIAKSQESFLDPIFTLGKNANFSKKLFARLREEIVKKIATS